MIPCHHAASVDHSAPRCGPFLAGAAGQRLDSDQDRALSGHSTGSAGTPALGGHGPLPTHWMAKAAADIRDRSRWLTRHARIGQAPVSRSSRLTAAGFDGDQDIAAEMLRSCIWIRSGMTRCRARGSGHRRNRHRSPAFAGAELWVLELVMPRRDHLRHRERHCFRTVGWCKRRPRHHRMRVFCTCARGPLGPLASCRGWIGGQTTRRPPNLSANRHGEECLRQQR